MRPHWGRAAFALVVGAASSVRAQGAGFDRLRVYQIDGAHSTIAFSVGFLGLARVRGSFRDYAGAITYDPQDATNSSVTVVLQTGSLDTHHEFRDTHLKSADFFDAERFPVIEFESRRVTRTAGGGALALHGSLTLHGVTREVTIPFRVVGEPSQDDGGNWRVAFSGAVTIDRRDFGILGGNRFNPDFDLRSAVIGDAVEITLDVLAFDFNVAVWPFGGSERPSVGPLLERAVERDGAARAADWYAALRRRAPDSLDYGVQEISKVGHRLLAAGRADAAIAVFALGAATFPSAPAFNTLGVAQLRAGRRDQALASFEQALRLNPLSPTAREFTRRLRQ